MAEDLNFEPILQVLLGIHEDFPDLRFGQVLQQAIDNSKQANNANFFDQSSKVILKSLYDFQEWTTKNRDWVKKKKELAKEKKQIELPTKTDAEYKEFLEGLNLPKPEESIKHIQTVYPEYTSLLRAVKNGQILPFKDIVTKKVRRSFGGLINELAKTNI